MGKTFVTKKYKQISKAVVNKFNQVTKGVSNAISGLNKKVQEQIAKRILEPFKKVLEPVIKPAKNLFDSLMKQIMKIPGLDKILKKIGLTSLGDAPKIASKFGAKTVAKQTLARTGSDARAFTDIKDILNPDEFNDVINISSVRASGISEIKSIQAI